MGPHAHSHSESQSHSQSLSPHPHPPLVSQSLNNSGLPLLLSLPPPVALENNTNGNASSNGHANSSIISHANANANANANLSSSPTAHWDTGDYFMLFAAVKLLCDSGHRCCDNDFWPMVLRTLESSSLTSRRLLESPHQILTSGFLAVINLACQGATLETVTEAQIELCSRALTYKRMHEVASAYNRLTEENQAAQQKSRSKPTSSQVPHVATNSLSIDVKAAKVTATNKCISTISLISPPNSTTLTGTTLAEDNESAVTIGKDNTLHTAPKSAQSKLTSKCQSRRCASSPSAPVVFSATEPATSTSNALLSSPQIISRKRSARSNSTKGSSSRKNSSISPEPPESLDSSSNTEASCNLSHSVSNALKIDSQSPRGATSSKTVIRLPQKRRAKSLSATSTPNKKSKPATPRKRGASLGATQSPNDVPVKVIAEPVSIPTQGGTSPGNSTPALEVLRQSPIRRLILYNSDISCAPSPKLTLTVPASPCTSPSQAQGAVVATQLSRSQSRSQSPTLSSQARPRAQIPHSPTKQKTDADLGPPNLHSILDEIEAAEISRTVAAALQQPRYRDKCSYYCNFDTIRQELSQGSFSRPSDLQIRLLMMGSNFSIVDRENTELAVSFCKVVDRIIGNTCKDE